MSTARQRNSLRFYQGDVQNYEVTTKEEGEKYQSAFYQTKKSYNILNMLLQPGMDSEYARVVREKKDLPLEILRQIEEILKIYDDIFAIMCEERRVRQECKTEESYHVYRVDRMQAMEMVRAGHTFGFTSCSLNPESGKQDQALREKDGLLLLEWEIPAKIPCVLLNQVLGRNRYEYQNELLLPPFIQFENKGELPFTRAELEYRDVREEPPKAKFGLQVKGMCLRKESVKCGGILEREKMESVLSILENLRRYSSVSVEEKERYCTWKDGLRQMVKNRFWEILSEGGIKK